VESKSGRRRVDQMHQLQLSIEGEWRIEQCRDVPLLSLRELETA